MTDPKDAFHAHLDACSQCRDHPFALCLVGLRLLFAIVAAMHEAHAVAEETN